jgi:hypothetical protein
MPKKLLGWYLYSPAAYTSLFETSKVDQQIIYPSQAQSIPRIVFRLFRKPSDKVLSIVINRDNCKKPSENRTKLFEIVHQDEDRFYRGNL